MKKEQILILGNMFVEFANIGSVEEVKQNGLPKWPLKDQWYQSGQVPITEKRTFAFRALVDLFVDYISHCDTFSSCDGDIGTLEYVDLLSSVKIAHIKELGGDNEGVTDQKQPQQDKEQLQGLPKEQKEAKNVDQPKEMQQPKDVKKVDEEKRDTKQQSSSKDPLQDETKKLDLKDQDKTKNTDFQKDDADKQEQYKMAEDKEELPKGDIKDTKKSEQSTKTDSEQHVHTYQCKHD